MLPISATPPGMVTLVNPEPWNAFAPMLVTFAPIVTFFSFVQLANALFPMAATFLPIVTVVSFFIPLNTFAPMDVTLYFFVPAVTVAGMVAAVIVFDFGRVYSTADALFTVYTAPDFIKVEPLVYLVLEPY